MLPLLKPLRLFHFALFLSLFASLALTSCQIAPPTTKAWAVGTANRKVRDSGRPAGHYNAPDATYSRERNGWTVHYTAVEALRPSQFDIFVADNGTAQFVTP